MRKQKFCLQRWLPRRQFLEFSVCLLPEFESNGFSSILIEESRDARKILYFEPQLTDPVRRSTRRFLVFSALEFLPHQRDCSK